MASWIANTAFTMTLLMQTAALSTTTVWTLETYKNPISVVCLNILQSEIPLSNHFINIIIKKVKPNHVQKIIVPVVLTKVF